jgi:hypothetical protein
MVLPQVSTRIWMALSDAAHDVITSPVMPIVEPGELVALANSPHILLSDVTNDKERWSIGGDHTLSGTMILTVMWPIASKISHTALKEIGAVIANHFPADRCMQYGGVRIRVTQDGDPLPAYVEGAYRVLPVRIFWSTVL